MGIFTEFLQPRAMNLYSGATLGVPLAPKVSQSNRDRIPPEELEAIYITDPITFNTVNIQVNLIMQAGFRIDASDSETQEYFDEFFESIGQIGEETTLHELLEYIYLDKLIYGKSFVELIYNRDDSRIVDLRILDPKVMDYARNSRGEVAVDRFGKPIGFTMKLPYGYSSEGFGDPVPKEYQDIVSLRSNQIFLLPKRIALFKVRADGDRFN